MTTEEPEPQAETETKAKLLAQVESAQVERLTSLGRQVGQLPPAADSDMPVTARHYVDSDGPVSTPPGPGCI